MKKYRMSTRVRIIRSITTCINGMWSNYWLRKDGASIDWNTHVSNNKRIVTVNIEINT